MYGAVSDFHGLYERLMVFCVLWLGVWAAMLAVGILQIEGLGLGLLKMSMLWAFGACGVHEDVRDSLGLIGLPIGP